MAGRWRRCLGIPAGPPASSGGLWMLAWAARRRCWWYDLAGERAGAGDHDQLPVAGAADGEGLVVCLLKDAQDVGHLRAAFGAGPWAVVKAFYRDITNRDDAAAWRLLGYRSRGAGYASFVVGYANT